MTTYMIIENGQMMDGDLYPSTEKLFRALPFANAGAQVLAFDLAACNPMHPVEMRDVTNAMVLAADADGAFAGYEEDCRYRLAGEYITFPLSKAEIEEMQAEYRRDLMAEGNW